MRCADPSADVRGPGRRPAIRPVLTTPAGVALGAALLFTGCGAPDSTVSLERSRLVRIKGERPGSARLEGVRAIRGFSVGRDCTFMHCLELVVEALGRDIGYDELMGISGMAFRLQVRAEPWDPGNPDPAVGASRLDVLFRDIGFDYQLRVVRREQLAAAQVLRKEIVKSVDAGVPVLAANIIPPEDWGIITGYERNGWSWKCRSYHGGAERVDRPARGWPTAVVLLTGRRPRPAPRQVHANAVKRAIALFDRTSEGPYALGRNAFEHWRQMLESARSRDYIHPNAWTYYCLIDARGSAVRFLRAVAEEFGSKKQFLLDAARLYEQEVNILRDGIDAVPWIDKFPTTLPPMDVRTRQINILMRAKALEERAINALRRAI